MSQTQMIVVDKYLLRRVNGKFTKDGMTLYRKGQKVLIDYMEEVNSNSHEHGWHFVKDEKATEELIELQKQKHAQKSEQDSATKTAQALVDVIGKAVSNSEPKKIEIPEGEPSGLWTKEQLRAYLTEKGIEFKSTYNTAKLLDLALGEGGENA